MRVSIENNTYELEERTFKTGSRGYGLYGKIVVDGVRYQIACNIIEIGSKPAELLLPTAVKSADA